MMGWTDRHERYFLRLLTRHAFLYSEMLPPGAILYGKRERFLAFDSSEHPVAIQLGGSDPAELAEASAIIEEWGYDEVNLNIGCPSQKGNQRRFGACLMAEPDKVARCVAAMQAAVSIPVTVKTRVGIDRQDAYEPFKDFVERVADAGCQIFMVHARKAWLDGLSPKENREVPPLRYDFVYRLKQERPDLEVIINGGIRCWQAAREHLDQVDGVMIGREAYQNPYFLAHVDRDFYHDDHPIRTREEVVQAFCPYVERMMAEGVPMQKMTRHILGLYSHQKRARAWRRYLTEEPIRPGAGLEVLEGAVDLIAGNLAYP